PDRRRLEDERMIAAHLGLIGEAERVDLLAVDSLEVNFVELVHSLGLAVGQDHVDRQGLRRIEKLVLERVPELIREGNFFTFIRPWLARNQHVVMGAARAHACHLDHDRDQDSPHGSLLRQSYDFGIYHTRMGGEWRVAEW